MRFWFLVALLALLPLAGCAGVQAEYVKADKATYAAIVPEYLKYVDADPDLDDDSKDLRRNTVASWEARIKAAKED